MIKILKLFTKKLTWIVVLSLSLVVLAVMLSQAKTEKERLKSNQKSLLEDVTFYKTSDSLNAASVQKLTLTNSEFKKHEARLNETIEKLHLKVNRLESASQTGTKTEVKVKTEIKDSLIYLPGRVDTLKCIDFKDPWVSVSGCIKDGRFDGLVQSADTLDQIVHRVPKKFLFIKYGTKAIRQEIVSHNPHTEIVYTKYIELR